MDKLYNSLAPKFKGIANSYKNLASQTKQIASNTLDKFSKQTNPGDIVAISNRLFWMEYPSNDKIEKLSSYLNTNHQNHYYIWNVGEREFTTEWFCNQVANHSHPGYPCPPLIELLMICKNIIYFLSSDRNNIAIVCCQETRGRSIMINILITNLKINLYDQFSLYLHYWLLWELVIQVNACQMFVKKQILRIFKHYFHHNINIQHMLEMSQMVQNQIVSVQDQFQLLYQEFQKFKIAQHLDPTYNCLRMINLFLILQLMENQKIINKEI